MVSRPITDDVLIHRMLPEFNADEQDRKRAWNEWQVTIGEPVLYRYVRAHNNTHEADDDILQDALLTAFLGLERGLYQPRDCVPFVSYAVGIARNKIREARRRDRFRVDLDEEQEERVPATSETFNRQPERAIERREQRELIRSGLSGLSEARRQVLEFYLSGASTGEIADRMSISEALVRQHKCRALRTLQTNLQHVGWIGKAC